MKKNTAAQNAQALELVLSPGDEPRVDSRAVAHELGIDHQNLMAMLKKHRSDFEEFGICPFRTDKLRGKGGGAGRPQEFALLTEGQALLAVAYAKPTEKSSPLKKKLVRLFLAFRKRAEQRASLDWQRIRSEGKVIRKQAMGTVARFVDYAKAQGSIHADKYFMLFSKLTNARLGIEVPPVGATRDGLDPEVLQAIQDVEMLEAATLIEAMSSGLPYKEALPLAKGRVEALNIVELRPIQRQSLSPAPEQPSLFGDIE